MWITATHTGNILAANQNINTSIKYYKSTTVIGISIKYYKSTTVIGKYHKWQPFFYSVCFQTFAFPLSCPRSFFQSSCNVTLFFLFYQIKVQRWKKWLVRSVWCDKDLTNTLVYVVIYFLFFIFFNLFFIFLFHWESFFKCLFSTSTCTLSIF